MPIELHDRDTWPPHETDPAGDGSTCLGDCTRCQLLALETESQLAERPLDFYTGAFGTEGTYHTHHYNASKDARANDNACRLYGHVRDAATGHCVRCGLPMAAP